MCMVAGNIQGWGMVTVCAVNMEWGRKRGQARGGWMLDLRVLIH